MTRMCATAANALGSGCSQASACSARPLSAVLAALVQVRPPAPALCDCTRALPAAAGPGPGVGRTAAAARAGPAPSARAALCAHAGPAAGHALAVGRAPAHPTRARLLPGVPPAAAACLGRAHTPSPAAAAAPLRGLHRGWHRLCVLEAAALLCTRPCGCGLTVTHEPCTCRDWRASRAGLSATACPQATQCPAPLAAPWGRDRWATQPGGLPSQDTARSFSSHCCTGCKAVVVCRAVLGAPVRGAAAAPGSSPACAVPRRLTSPWLCRPRRGPASPAQPAPPRQRARLRQRCPCCPCRTRRRQRRRCCHLRRQTAQSSLQQIWSAAPALSRRCPRQRPRRQQSRRKLHG